MILSAEDGIQSIAWYVKNIDRLARDPNLMENVTALVAHSAATGDYMPLYVTVRVIKRYGPPWEEPTDTDLLTIGNQLRTQGFR